MTKQKAVAVFDVGKTNKKVLLFDEQYAILSEETKQFEETVDEDGFACEDVQALTKWVGNTFRKLATQSDYDVRAVNFSAYGASFVHLDAASKPLTPLYNYLKPYPEKIKQQFYDTYGDERAIAQQTASPVLGSLNSGMQLYRLKIEQPDVFARIQYSLHLPQYLSFILSSKTATDITSVGCHTQLWDFQKNSYHRWVYAEGLHTKFAPLYCGAYDTETIAIGSGLHDSSSALIPYYKLFKNFILVSTGTWSISLNPCNNAPLTDYELQNDCLCYLTYQGKPVKASRVFAGHEHEEQVKRIAAHFHKDIQYYTHVMYDRALQVSSKPAAFGTRSLDDFATYEQAYHQLMWDIMATQVHAIKLVLGDTAIEHIFVDGGFSKNDLFMHMLAATFADMKVYAAKVAQASALGAALVMHPYWNQKAVPTSLIASLIDLTPVTHT